MVNNLLDLEDFDIEIDIRITGTVRLTPKIVKSEKPLILPKGLKRYTGGKHSRFENLMDDIVATLSHDSDKVGISVVTDRIMGLDKYKDTKVKYSSFRASVMHQLVNATNKIVADGFILRCTVNDFTDNARAVKHYYLERFL